MFGERDDDFVAGTEGLAERPRDEVDRAGGAGGEDDLPRRDIQIARDAAPRGVERLARLLGEPVNAPADVGAVTRLDRKSTRLNSSH